MDKKIAEIREGIDRVDDAILELLGERAELVTAMKKAKGGVKIFRPTREAEILRRVVAHNNTGLSDATIRSIFTEIVTGGRNLEEQLKVAYLGPEGSFSHDAAIELLGSQSDFHAFDSLGAAIKATEGDVAEVVLLPIENSTEGQVAETLKLLQQTSLEIIGEIDLPIVHCLLTEAKDIKKIKEVHAHPQALGQCRAWLEKHVPQAILVPTASNSEAAQHAKSSETMAAIASERAASVYKVPVHAVSIQDMPDNRTRFVALSKTPTQPTDHDKTSVICTTKDKPGALHELLGIFLQHGTNLLRLVSHPQPDGDYAFHIDFEGHKDTPDIAKLLVELESAARTCKIIGSYPRSA